MLLGKQRAMGAQFQKKRDMTEKRNQHQLHNLYNPILCHIFFVGGMVLELLIVLGHRHAPSVV